MSTDRPPNHARIRPPRIAACTTWLARERGLNFDNDDALWRVVLENPVMPGARGLPSAQLNCARRALPHADAAHAAGHSAT